MRFCPRSIPHPLTRTKANDAGEGSRNRWILTPVVTAELANLAVFRDHAAKKNNTLSWVKKVVDLLHVENLPLRQVHCPEWAQMPPMPHRKKKPTAILGTHNVSIVRGLICIATDCCSCGLIPLALNDENSLPSAENAFSFEIVCGGLLWPGFFRRCGYIFLFQFWDPIPEPRNSQTALKNSKRLKSKCSAGLLWSNRFSFLHLLCCGTPRHTHSRKMREHTPSGGCVCVGRTNNRENFRVLGEHPKNNYILRVATAEPV